MKNIFLSVFLLFGFLFCSSEAQPKLEIQGGDTYDWGKVNYKDIKDAGALKAKVVIKNTGTELLKISEVKPGCGCTTAPLDKSDINPGDTATLDVTLRVGAGAHDLMKNIRIASNDPKEPNKLLYLKASIFQPIDISPNYFAFNEMKVGAEATSSIKIKNNTDAPITLSSFEAQPENMKVDLKKKTVIKPGQEITVTAKVKPEKQGSYNCNLKVMTTNTDMPELNISGYGNVKESPLFNGN